MKTAKIRPDVEEIASVLSYDAASGVFRWVVSRRGMPVSQVAGSLNQYGYRRIVVAGRRYLASNLAWLLVHGEWPTRQIDHKNGIRCDDRIDNLRLATRSQNMGNTNLHRDNRTGLKGVWLDRRRKKYCAQICVDGVKRSLGSYDNPEDAHAAYRTASREAFGEYARTQ